MRPLERAISFEDLGGPTMRKRTRSHLVILALVGIFEVIPLSFWYDAPLISPYSDRRHNHGWFAVHRPTVPSDGIPGFHQPDARRVSAAGPALRDRVPRPDGGLADGWETANRTPVYRLQKLPPPDTG